MRLGIAAIVFLSTCGLLIGDEPSPLVIEVVDQETERGVPMIRLETVAGEVYYTDSAGMVAIRDPALIGRRVFFQVSGHGYEFPADGFGFRGKALQIEPGAKSTLKVKRVNIAERLYRLTGEGIYRDSVIAGLPVPIEHPLLNAKVTGCDSVQSAVYRGRLHWFWGDTNRIGYPLGCFKATGARSELPSNGGLAPETGVDFQYWTDERGFARAMAPLPHKGPTWLSGLVVLKDDDGQERMFAHFVNVTKGMKTVERGLVEFNDETETFEVVAGYPLDGPFPSGAHAFLHDENGKQYVYFADPFPLIRVEAEPSALADLACYEAFTPLTAGTRKSDMRLDRDANGRLDWAWKADTDPLHPADLSRLLKQKAIAPTDARLILHDVETGVQVIAHRGTVHWNAYRNRWIMIACEVGGTSMLGEIWYAEAGQLEGPWTKARKIVTHDTYSFYNPAHHPVFDKDGGRIVFFDGTYTSTFSGAKQRTPLYDYNQIMYKLDLSDPRLDLSRDAP